MRLEHFFRKAAELDLKGVAVSDLRLLERADYGYLSSLRRSAEEANLYLQLTYAGFRADNLQDAARLTGAVGGRSLCFRPVFERPLSAQTMQTRMEELYDMVAKALPVAERYSVNLTLGGGGSLTAEELLVIHENLDSELVSLGLDPAFSFSVLEDPVEWAQVLAPYVSSVRLSDYNIVSDPAGARLLCCPLGEGVVNVRALIEVLKRSEGDFNLFVSTPQKSVPLPFLDTVFLERLHHLRPAQLARIVRLLKEQGLESPPPSQPADLPEDEILAEEDDRFQQSLEWLRCLIGEGESAGEPSEETEG